MGIKIKSNDALVKIKRQTVEKDIAIQLPSGKRIIVQYRNYEGDDDGTGASVDIVLPEPTFVHNWIGEGMKPCKTIKGHQAEHWADQLMIVL